MYKFFLSILAVLLFAQGAWAGFGDFSLAWNEGGKKWAFYQPFTVASSVLTGTFTRNSAANYSINGFYQSFAANQPGTDSKGVWLEGSSTNKVTCYSALTESLGSELITVAADREFSSDTGWWGKNAGTTISGGVANVSGVTASALYKAGVIAIGKVYTVTYTITVTSGSLAVSLGNGTPLTAHTTSGTYTDEGVCIGDTTYRFTATGFTGSIDNVSIKEVYNAIGTKATATSTTAIRGMTLGSATASTAEIIAKDYTGTAYGSIVPGARIVRVTNSDAGAVTVTITGTAGNTNKHSGQVVAAKVSGSGTSTIGINATTTTITGSTLTHYKVENATPLSGSQLVFSIGAGDVVDFVLPDFEEQVACTSFKISVGATNTRAATLLSYPVTGAFSIPMTGTFYWTPNGIKGSAEYLWGSYLDANNYMGVFYDGTNITFRKRVGGSNFDATKALTAVVGTTYRIGWRINSDYSTDVAVNSVMGTGSADTTPPATTTTYQIGTLNGTTGTISSQIKDFKIYRKALADSRM